MNKLFRKKKSWNINISIGSISSADLLFFTRHLGLALKSGLTLFDALVMLTDQAGGKLKNVLNRVTQTIQAGEPLHKALERYPKYFSPLYLNLVKTGELSGTLEANLNYLAENLRKSRELKQKVTSAMIYPVLIFVAVLGLGFGITVFILPKIIPLLKTLNVELPWTTQALIFISDACTQYGIYLTVALVVGFITLVSLVKQDFAKPFTHRLILNIPVFGTIVRNVNLQMFTHTLGTLLVSNVPVDSSLKITADAINNRVYQKVLNQCSEEVQKGNTLAVAFERHPQLFPKILKHMVAMGERTGNLDTTLKYISEFYEAEVDVAVKNLSTIIEPFLLIFIGSIVGIVAMAILGPIYQITGNINVK